MRVRGIARAAIVVLAAISCAAGQEGQAALAGEAAAIVLGSGGAEEARVERRGEATVEPAGTGAHLAIGDRLIPPVGSSTQILNLDSGRIVSLAAPYLVGEDFGVHGGAPGDDNSLSLLIGALDEVARIRVRPPRVHRGDTPSQLQPHHTWLRTGRVRFRWRAPGQPRDAAYLLTIERTDGPDRPWATYDERIVAQAEHPAESGAHGDGEDRAPAFAELEPGFYRWRVRAVAAGEVERGRGKAKLTEYPRSYQAGFRVVDPRTRARIERALSGLRPRLIEVEDPAVRALITAGFLARAEVFLNQEALEHAERACAAAPRNRAAQRLRDALRSRMRLSEPKGARDGG